MVRLKLEKDVVQLVVKDLLVDIEPERLIEVALENDYKLVDLLRLLEEFVPVEHHFAAIVDKINFCTDFLLNQPLLI